MLSSKSTISARLLNIESLRPCLSCTLTTKPNRKKYASELNTIEHDSIIQFLSQNKFIVPGGFGQGHQFSNSFQETFGADLSIE